VLAVVVRLVAVRVELSYQRSCALVDHGFQLDIGDVWERQVEHVAGLRQDGGEEAVEEDGVQDAADYVPHRSRVGEGFEDEFGGGALVHFGLKEGRAWPDEESCEG
jgi:hypothetical protein